MVANAGIFLNSLNCLMCRLSRLQWGKLGYEELVILCMNELRVGIRYFKLTLDEQVDN